VTREEIIAAARQSIVDNPPPSISEARRLIIQTIMQPESTGLAA
jgi:hypothetical protein